MIDISDAPWRGEKLQNQTNKLVTLSKYNHENVREALEIRLTWRCLWKLAVAQLSPAWPLSSSSLLLEMQWSSSTLATGDNPDASSSFRSLKHVTSGALSAANSYGDRPCRAVAGLVCCWSTSSDRREHGTFNRSLLISGPCTEAIMTKTHLTFKRLFRDIKG